MLAKKSVKKEEKENPRKLRKDKGILVHIIDRLKICY